MTVEKKQLENFNGLITNFLIKNQITLDQFWIMHLKYWEDNTHLIKLCTNITDDEELVNKVIKKRDGTGKLKAITIESKGNRYTHDEMFDLVEKGLIEDFDYDRELKTNFIKLTPFCEYLLNAFYSEMFPKTEEESTLSDLEEKFGNELFDVYPNTAYNSSGGIISQLKSFKRIPRKEVYKMYYNAIEGDSEKHREIVNKIKSNYAEIKGERPVGNYHLCIGFVNFVDSRIWEDLSIVKQGQDVARREA